MTADTVMAPTDPQLRFHPSNLKRPVTARHQKPAAAQLTVYTTGAGPSCRRPQTRPADPH